MAGGPNQSAANQQQQQQLQQQQQQQQQQGPRTKSFDNPSASSTASSGVGTSISSINSTNPNLASLNNNANAINTSAPPTPNVVKKYYEQKYGSTTNMAGGGPMSSPIIGGNNMSQTGMNSPMIDTNKMMPPRNGVPRNSMFNQQPAAANITTSNIKLNIPSQQQQQPSSFININNNQNNQNNPNNPLGAGLSSLTSQFTSGIANLKLTASTFQTNKLTSKFMNPFSS